MSALSATQFSDHQLEQLSQLESKINALLPPRYQGCFEVVPPKSMGSAGLKFDAEGKVAWGQIWTTFCHLALAGGPPHKGSLLAAVPRAEAENEREAYDRVVAELERAIKLTTRLTTFTSPTPGWVGVHCDDAEMAAWLVRAIVAENVTARAEGTDLFVPAGPQFRIDKEMKNVVTSLAKTCHYLVDHMDPNRQRVDTTRPLIAPALPDEINAAPDHYAAVERELEQGIRQVLRMETVPDRAPGWLGIRCRNVPQATWLLRAIVIEDVLVRREQEILFVPISLSSSRSQGVDRVLAVVAHAHRVWQLFVARYGEPEE
jgi:hypothetical protein